MTIVLFAIIGALLHAPAYYWICYGVWCFFVAVDFIIKVFTKIMED